MNCRYEVELHNKGDIIYACLKNKDYNDFRCKVGRHDCYEETKSLEEWLK